MRDRNYLHYLRRLAEDKIYLHCLGEDLSSLPWRMKTNFAVLGSWWKIKTVFTVLEDNNYLHCIALEGENYLHFIALPLRIKTNITTLEDRNYLHCLRRLAEDKNYLHCLGG